LIKAAEAVLLLIKIVVIGVIKTNDNAPTLANEHDQKNTADNTNSVVFIITIMRHASVALALRSE
jgi:hypothetical protein